MAIDSAQRAILSPNAKESPRNLSSKRLKMGVANSQSGVISLGSNNFTPGFARLLYATIIIEL